MNRRLLTAPVAALLLLALVGPATAAPAGQAVGTKAFTHGGTFIVQLAEWPVVAYDGGIKGYKATAPAPGRKIDPNSASVTAYAGYLAARHDTVLKSVGASKKLYDYVYSYNGFAAKLTAAQANKLAVAKGVVHVTMDTLQQVDTSSTPTFLGLDADNGLWDQLGGVGKAGEGIIIGDVDSGIWPESLSFSDRVDANGVPSSSPGAKKVFQQIPGWHGKCTPGEAFAASDCNQKLIGARYFNAGWGGNAGINASLPWEFNSPRDYNGHGTHTASTAGGNHGVPTSGPAAVFGSINGMAPRARIAMYKALWSKQDGSQANGYTSDLTAAIDQAVADGVDVINYSISGTTTDYADPAEISFLFAARAGIFVSESAGNEGPGPSTVAHPAPWTTTVAAGTHNRSISGSVTLGNATTYEGASIATAVGPAPLINASDAALAGADATMVRLCYAAIDNGGVAVLDPAKVAGKIVVCDRGVTARVNKSLAVQQAGGVGMVLVNTSPSSLNADFHWVPTVHLPDTDAAAMHAYAATVGATATINAAQFSYDADAPFTASFSSRGPSLAGGDILKPDVIAPGQDILAAVAPPGNNGLTFNLYSGTSMSSPHVAGVAALLMDLHPSWTPMEIKSALMTSAYDVLDEVSTTARIFSQGAGHIAPNGAADPGLVFNAGWNDWLAFLCGTTSAVGAATCSTLAGIGYSLDPSDYNGPSIAIAAMAGVQTVHRSVTGVGPTEQYTLAYTGLTGIDVSFDPGTFSIGQGATKPIDVTFTSDGAALNAYAGGFITLTGNHGHVVRIPVVIRPVAMAAPATLTQAATSDSGSFTWDVTPGYTGSLTANGYGLVADDSLADQVVAQDPDQNPATNPFGTGVYLYDFTLAAGTQYWAGGTMAATTEAGSDLDVYLLRENADGNPGFSYPDDLVAQSADGDSEEIVDLRNPVADNYRLMVHGWGTPDGASTFTLHHWLVLGSADAGSLVATAGSGDPAAVTIGSPITVTGTYSGSSAVGTQYRGIVTYFDGTSVVGRTVLILNR